MTKAKPLPPLELFKTRFRYDEVNGALILRQTSKQVGSYNKTNGYLYVKVEYRNYAVHRICWYMFHGVDPLQRCIDHADGNKLNNKIDNLRLATFGQNNCNKRLTSRNTSGFKGVFRHGLRWKAEIGIEGNAVYLGTFDTPELAHMAYCKAAAELHGEFARAT